MTHDLHGAVETVLVLLLIIFTIAVVVQRIHLPYTIALVLAGLFGFQPGFRHIVLTPDLILVVFLPLLLFEGAYNVSATRLRDNLLPISLLAGPGVLFGMLITGAIVHLLLGLGWGPSLLFGALISSTDPIAVVSLFRELGAPKRLALLVEGESLFNDGAAITLFQITLAALATGAFSLGSGALDFVISVVGALVAGGAVGYACSFLVRRLDHIQLQITATVLAAYGAYLLAERFAVSGAIAVVVTGLLVGNYGATSGVSPGAVHALGATWEFLGFIANSLVFLLIGIELDPLGLARNWWPILAAFGATVIARLCAVYLLLPWLRGARKIPARFHPVIVWGGLRGAVSLALMLSIPFTLSRGRAFPGRGTLQTLTFGVVGVSLVAQGLTMRPLIHRLRLGANSTPDTNADALHARLLAVEGALSALASAHATGEVGGLPYDRLRNAYQTEHDDLSEQLRPHMDETTAAAPD
ncbi:MAG TPA: cation:proton antiporter [Ktedonobacterales bacterium]|nr:cation:proton antiporter [Ktedonobacterales bacterium]